MKISVCNKNAFTLIELLAVIVILAIIALIAVPIIINIINDSRENANKRSIELYGKAIEQAIAKAQLNEEEIVPGDLDDVELSTGEKFLLTVQYNGSRVACTTNKLYSDGSIYLEGCTVGTDTKEYTYGTKKICTANKTKVIANIFDGNNNEEQEVGLLATPGHEYDAGVTYTCNIGGENRTFFVLGRNRENSSKIDLIMDRNYTDEVPATMSWCDTNGDNPFDNICNHDNIDQYIEYIQEQFGNKVTVSLPTVEQIQAVEEYEILDIYYGNTGPMSSWLYGNLYDPVKYIAGYWTASPVSWVSTLAFTVQCNGYLHWDGVPNPQPFGLRPVITISKSDVG